MKEPHLIIRTSVIIPLAKEMAEAVITEAGDRLYVLERKYRKTEGIEPEDIEILDGKPKSAPDDLIIEIDRETVDNLFFTFRLLDLTTPPVYENEKGGCGFFYELEIIAGFNNFKFKWRRNFEKDESIHVLTRVHKSIMYLTTDEFREYYQRKKMENRIC
ncbi:MAG: hypothetical protein RBS89_07275 [Candidatus Delongbacteria bacterium]|jgi:hypothetical protein|nr:hypothetical protein [Candidatus Delongbacteria bacterium]